MRSIDNEGNYSMLSGIRLHFIPVDSGICRSVTLTPMALGIIRAIWPTKSHGAEFPSFEVFESFCSLHIVLAAYDAARPDLWLSEWGRNSGLRATQRSGAGRHIRPGARLTRIIKCYF